jgi:hypothetical protein
MELGQGSYPAPGFDISCILTSSPRTTVLVEFVNDIAETERTIMPSTSLTCVGSSD